jgi:hypothetical protein
MRLTLHVYRWLHGLEKGSGRVDFLGPSARLSHSHLISDIRPRDGPHGTRLDCFFLVGIPLSSDFFVGSYFPAAIRLQPCYHGSNLTSRGACQRYYDRSYVRSYLLLTDARNPASCDWRETCDWRTWCRDRQT